MLAPLLLCLCSGLSFSQDLDHRFFLGQILEKYGRNGSITYEGFERLYQNLGLGNISDHHTHSHEHEHESTVNPSSAVSEHEPLLSRISRGIILPSGKDSSEEQLESLVDQHEEVTMKAPPSPAVAAPQCLAPAQLLAVYGVPRSGSGLSPVSFLHLCPAIVYQLDQHSCAAARQLRRNSPVVNQPAFISDYRWFYAVLTIVVISFSGLIIVAIVPILHKMYINTIISFLVALAVGTLLGDAFLHLIPHALESHSHGSGHDDHDGHGDQEHHQEQGGHMDSVMKTGLMFLTMVFFFTFEAVLNIKKEKKGESVIEETAYTPVSVTVHKNEKEMMQMVGDAPEVTPKSPLGGHGHSHTATMVIMGDGLHNLTDGLAIGAAFSGGLAPGFATAVAVFTHELPHELGDFAVLLQSGVTVRKALFYNVVSSIISFLGVIVGLVVGNFGDSTRWIYAITAGSFVYIALSNLVPEMNREKSSCQTILLRVVGMLCGGAIMGCIALFEEEIQNMFS